MSDTRFLVVTDRLTDGNPNSTAERSATKVKRYLYGGSFLLTTEEHFSEFHNSYVAIHLLLVGGRTDAEADLYAQVQADRLRSGLNGVTVYDSYAAAIAHDTNA